MAVIKYVVITYAIVGVGVGLAGLLGGSLAGGVRSGAVFGAFSALVGLFGGGILAAVFGMQDAVVAGDDSAQRYLLGFASTAIGYIVMGLIFTVFFTLAGASAAAGGASAGGIFLATVLMSIPTGGITVGVLWLRDWPQSPPEA